MPPEETAPKSASARSRAGSSGALVVSRASTPGAAIAAPTPWSGAGGHEPLGRLRQPAEERGEREDGDAAEEQPAAAEDVAEPAAEQQQAAEGEGEGVQHPGEGSRAEAQVGVDLGERDVHDRRVEDEHQLRDQHDRDAHRGAAGVVGEVGRAGRRPVGSRASVEVMQEGPVLAGWAEVLLIRRMAPLPPLRYGDSLRLARCMRRVQMRADAKRNYDRLVEVARAVFREQGYDASLDEVAKRAGVGPGTLYRHFPNPGRAARRDHAELGRQRGRGRREDPRPRGLAARPAPRLVPGVRAADQHAQGRAGQDHLGDGRPRLPDPHQVPGAAQARTTR